MHTVIGWNSTSPDQQYRIRIVAHGASAKPFSATTKKRVYVSFLSNSTSNPAPLMEKKYVFAAADLRSTTTWRGSDEALIEFFDYPSSSSENLGGAIESRRFPALPERTRRALYRSQIERALGQGLKKSRTKRHKF